MSYQTLKTEQRDEQVLLVTLERPEVLNAINTQMGHDLYQLWTGLAAEPGDLRCVVLTGSGKRAFCAGADLKEREGMPQPAWQAQHELFERGFVALLELPLPVIAAANGHAYGGGLELLLGCDFIYAAPGARFALSEVGLGLMPGLGGPVTLPRAVGERRAKELILTAKPFTMQEAAAWGLVNRVCDEPLEAALATAKAISENAPLSVRQAKKAIHHGLQTDLLTAFRFSLEAYNRLVDTEDRREGVRAFNEKRKPAFKGK